MRAGVLLSGCGVFDGTDLHEGVLTLLALKKNRIEYKCFSINNNQHHVVNHLNGEFLTEKRNMMVESSRISRGDISEIKDFKSSDFQFLVIPGGFGVAKNFSTWAFDDQKCKINKGIKRIIKDFYISKKPILSLCISPTIVAVSLASFKKKIKLTIGSENHSSAYNISKLQNSLKSLGVQVESCSISDVCIDKDNLIVSAPCYMMEASINLVYNNINNAIKELIKLKKKTHAE